MRRQWSRRDVLSGLGAAGLASLGLEVTRIPSRASSPNDRLNLAVIGCGGQGAENLKQVSAENIVALCDVDDERGAEAFKQFPRAKRFRDYRKLLDAMHGQIDAVVVSIPDHMHAPVSLAAMDLGKHVYCEKPLTWSIEEARRMARVARREEAGHPDGHPGHGPGRFPGRNRGHPHGRARRDHGASRLDRPTGGMVAAGGRSARRTGPRCGVDWTGTSGSAWRRERPYHPAYCPFVWRGWKDFGTGAVGDMGIHNAAMPFAALDLGPPSSAELVATSGLKPETFPVWSRLKLGFPARGGRGPITLYWYDGGQKPPADLVAGRKLADNGAIVVGKKGTLSSVEWTGGDWILLPEDRFRDFKSPQPSVPRAPAAEPPPGMARACRGGPPAFCRFDGFASRLTETMLVANLALRTGRKIDWDAETMTARGCPEAAPFITRAYRTGW